MLLSHDHHMIITWSTHVLLTYTPQAAPEGKLTSLKSNFHYDEFLWAVACVMSRQNEIPTPPGHTSPTLALIPVWDLCNHEGGSITTFFSMETHTCDCYAMKDFKSNKEFTIFYGPRTNSDLLMQQGFTYMQNKHDRLLLKLGKGTTDIFCNW